MFESCNGHHILVFCLSFAHYCTATLAVGLCSLLWVSSLHQELWSHWHPPYRPGRLSQELQGVHPHSWYVPGRIKQPFRSLLGHSAHRWLHLALYSQPWSCLSFQPCHLPHRRTHGNEPISLKNLFHGNIQERIFQGFCIVVTHI